jgi:hypothetical protein
MAQTSVAQPINLADLVRNSLYGFNARVAAPAATLPAQTPSVRSWSAPLPAQDEQAVQRGHAERREARAAYVAGKQVEALIAESLRLGQTIRPDCAHRLARVACNAYADYLGLSRR